MCKSLQQKVMANRGKFWQNLPNSAKSWQKRGKNWQKNGVFEVGFY